MGMRRTAALAILTFLAVAAPAGAAARCDFRGSKTVVSSTQARVFWVKGKGDAKRVYFGCRRDRKPILLTTDLSPKPADETHTTNRLFRLAGTWVAWHRTTSNDFGAGEAGAVVTVRSLAGARRAVEQDVSRYAMKSLALAPDGGVAWVLGTGDFREVGGVARGAKEPTPLAVARGIDSQSLKLRGGKVRFALGGRTRTLALVPPAPPPGGSAIGPQGLDGRFGDCGTLVPASPKPDVFTEATQLARTPDGALVAAGTTTSNADPEQAEQDTFVVARFSADGKFDPAFGKTGVVQVRVPRPAGAQNAELTGAVVQPDGKVLVAGHVELDDPVDAQAILVRFDADGTLDESFGTGGMVQDAIPATRSARIEDLALTAGGAILVTGQRDGRYYVARLTPGGSADAAFGAGGLVADTGKDPSALAALAVAPDGTIFAAGGAGQPLLVRLAPDGTLLSVSSEGPPAVAALRALEPTADGGVIAAGAAANVSAPAQALLARYGADGKPDDGFGAGGFVLDPQISNPNDVAVTPDGSLLVTASFFLRPGGYSGSGLVRYTAAGARDTGFGFRGALGGTSSFGLVDHDVLVGADGTAHVAQDNGGAFGISRFAVEAPAVGLTRDRSTVCAMASALKIAPLVQTGKLDVSLRLRAPGKLRLDAVLRVGDRSVNAGTVAAFRPYTEGAVATIPLTKPAVALLRGAKTAQLTVTGGAPGRAKTTYSATLAR